MTVLHKSTLAFRRLAISRQHRKYTQLSHPVHRISESEGAAASSTRSRLQSNSWVFVNATIALFGLGFSTFSAHQLVSCKDAKRP